jgi:hypothetical protein
MKRYILPVLLLGSLAGTSAYMVRRGSEQTEARQLSQSLRRHQYYYHRAFDQQHALITAALRALDSGAPLSGMDREVSEIKGKLTDLHDRLEALPVDGSVRDRMLVPLLRQLRYESGELAQMADLLSRASEADMRAALRQRLTGHRHPKNLLEPALQQIADQYGLPRQRLWRGRPLVS